MVFRKSVMLLAKRNIQPLKALFDVKNRTVTVEVKGNTKYRGRLLECDEYMNLILVDAEELLEETKSVRRYGDVFIRGNNIVYIQIE